MLTIQKAIEQGCCQLSANGRSLEQIIRDAVAFLHQSGRLNGDQVDGVIRGLLDREAIAPTAIGRGFSVPHFYDDTLSEPIALFIRLRRPRNLNAPDGIPVRFVCVLLGPRECLDAHIDALAGIARIASDDEFLFQAQNAKTKAGLVEAIEAHRDRNQLAQLVKPREVLPSLQHRLPGAGLWSDLKKSGDHYIRDVIDGFRPKCIASVLFLFFACLAPAITFGGIMGDATGGQIGAEKMLFASAICGLAYALFAGQPLIILGGIGPILIFTIILYRVCITQGYEDDFLSIYGWVGVWTSLLTIVLAVTNASNWMRFFTRFTDEIFSVLMSAIFIYEACRALFAIFKNSFAVEGGSHDAAFLSLILALGTFYIASSLASFRRSKYLVPWMREFLADFGPSIALAGMALLAWFLQNEVRVDTLQVEANVSWQVVTSWRVDLGAIDTSVKLLTILPAMLATVLIFLSQNITSRLVNSPQNKMHDQATYHQDLLVVGLMVGGCSLYGLPWLAAATVRSLSHVRALASVDEIVSRNGPTKERIIHVTRNRITGLAIHGLIFGSLFFLELLNFIPRATLYGIFLFMGVVSLGGIQFIERLSLLFMDSALYPSTHYIRRLPVARIHLFTLVQLVCLIILCVINVIPIQWVQILFPVFIALLIPVRGSLRAVFSDEELAILDTSEDPVEEASHWF